MKELEYNLSLSQLKEKADTSVSDPTIQRYKDLNLLKPKKHHNNQRYLYSEEDVLRLKLIDKLKRFGYYLSSIGTILDSVPLDLLEKKVSNSTPEQLDKFLRKHGVDIP